VYLVDGEVCRKVPVEIERTEVHMIILLRYLDFNLICYFSTPGEIEEKLNIPEILRDQRWFTQPSCDGLHEGLTWVCDMAKPDHAKQRGMKEGRKKERKGGGKEGGKEAGRARGSNSHYVIYNYTL